MTDAIPRLRMFAGPNGSGKTTVKNGLERGSDWFGIYLNPDELESDIRKTGKLPLDQFDLTATDAEVKSHFASSSLLKNHDLAAAANQIRCDGNIVDFAGFEINSYHASVLADFVRRKALQESRTFSFETVMSSRDKVDLLNDAQLANYRTYLYYIATEDPEINIQRVRNRVAEGGHDVPEEKIRSRYDRSLKLLPEALERTNRAFLFDTSGEEPTYFAEVTDGKTMDLKCDEIPNWFRPIWERFS